MVGSKWWEILTCLSEGEFNREVKVAISHFASSSKVGFTEIYSEAMKKILDNGMTIQHIVVGRVPHLESEDLIGFVFSLYQM